MQLDGYLGALGQIPSYDQLKMNALAMRGEEQRQAVVGQQAQQQQQLFDAQKAEQDDFLTGIKALGDNATPDQYARLAARHPTLKGIATAAEQLGESQRRQVVGAAAQINQALANNRPDLAKAVVQRSIDAAKASGGKPDEDDVALLAMLNSDDPEQIKAAKGMSYAIVAAANPDTAARNVGEYGATSERKGQVVGRSIGHYDDATGQFVIDYRDPEGVSYEKIKNADGTESLVEVTKGGGQASAGGAATGDVSRLINSDAGGGYVPAGIKTLGQFVNWGKTLNQRGAKSSSAGTYQINGSTMAQFAPQVLGANWRDQPFDAAAQEKVGEAIFNWAKTQPDPASALKGRWVSLSQNDAARLVQGSWSQARGQIAQGETGGGARSSASRLPGERPNTGPRVVFTSKPAEGSAVDGATVQFYAEKIAAGGDLPALGSGKEASAWRQAILKRAAQIQNGNGVTGGDSNLAQADVKANRSALLQAQKQYTSTVGFEDTFQRNVKEVLRLAPQGVGGSAPIFNRWIQAGRKNIKGDPAVSAFNVAVNTAANEYAKLASGASGGAVTSDSARHEAMEILNNAQTLPQLQASIKQMQIDGHNRVVALDTQIARLRGNISGAGRGGGTTQPAPARAPAGGRLIGTYQGRAVYQLANGKRVVAK